MGKKYSVPYKTVTIDVYEVEASGPNQALLKAEDLRRANTAPTHSHVSKFDVLAVKLTVLEPVPADEGIDNTPARD